MSKLFAQRTQGARRSVLRELLKLTDRPEIISFAGGLPDPATFPTEFLAKVAEEEVAHNAVKSLQYTTTEGKRPLREALTRWFAGEGIEFTMDQIVITTGSQQGLDLLSWCFLDSGDAVFVSLPDYIGALQAFWAYQATLVGVPLEEDGMDLEILRARIREARRTGHTPKLIYLVPDFQNPTGLTWSEEKRRELLRIATEEDLYVVEDMPYRRIRFSGETIPAVGALDEEGRVIVLFTFSKILAAGLRVGAVAGSEEVLHAVVTMKQAADLCSPSLTQRLAVRFLTDYDVDGHLEMLCHHYRVKRDAMLAALDRYMPDGVSWTKPDGGLFLWVRLPEGLDATSMLAEALKHNVAYAVGSAFFADGSGNNTMRLSYSSATVEEIEEGIRRLAKVTKEAIASHPISKAA